MKAAVLEDINRLVIKDVPEPPLRPDEILIKVRMCGICGTDVKLFRGSYSAKTPVILGHEFAGEVVKVGNDVSKIKVGERVVVDPNESCGRCYWCRSGNPCFCNELAAYGVLRDGGFAEYVKVTEKGAYKMPPQLDYESACFAEPVSCAVHCMDRAEIKPGESVLIIGGGPMGQIILQFALRSGANPLIMATRSPFKLELSRRLGATDVVNVKEDNLIERVMDITHGFGVDVVIEAVGSTETVEQAMKLVKKAGRVVIFGFSPEKKEALMIPFDILSKEITILGSWVNPYTFDKALDLLGKGFVNVKPLVSKIIPLENIMAGLKMMEEKPEGFFKALVRI